MNTYGYVGDNPITYSDPYGLFGWADMGLPQWVVDSSAGFGDTLSLGLTNAIRNGMGTNGVVDKCSKSYATGEASGIVLAAAIGGAEGWEAAGTRGAGQEFSRWIPSRIGGPRSLWNGNKDGSNCGHGTTYGVFVNAGANAGPLQWDSIDAHGGYDSTTGHGYHEGPLNHGNSTFGSGAEFEMGGGFGVEIVGH